MRKPIATTELRRLADELSAAAKRLSDSVAECESAELPEIWLHFGLVASTYIPRLTDWSLDVQRDATKAVLAFQAGRRSAGEASSSNWKARRARSKKPK